MSVITRSALDDSPLADLHELASELSIDGFRRLRRPALIDAILERQGGEPAAETPEEVEEEKPAPRRRRTRKTTKTEDEEPTPEPVAEAKPEATDGEPEATEAEGDSPAADDDEPAPRRRRSRRGGRSRAGSDEEDTPSPEEAPEPRSRRGESKAPKGETEAPAGEQDELVEGVVELLANGSGFVRVDPPEPSDNDVYISAAQVKRCELISGDRVSGPRRPPRRSERFASLVRVDSVNGRPAAELADGLHFDDLPASFPAERIPLGSEDPTLKALEFLTPFGRGSRVSIIGGPRAGKTEAISRLAQALSAHEDLQVSVALAGARPEEISEANRSATPPAGAASFAASADAQAHAVELVVDQAQRVATRGAHAVVLIDSLDGLNRPVARRVMAAARNLVDGGSLTIIAASSEPVGGETTVIALDPLLTAQHRFPALDFSRSGTVRPELLVGEEAATAIARTRAEALGN